MQDKDSEKFPAAQKYNLITSPAFLDLKPAARMILILFLYEIKFKQFGKEKKWLPTNEDKIILPYKEISERLKYSDMTIWRAIQDIMAHGFLDIVQYGGKSKGDFTIYAVKTAWTHWEPGKVYFKSAPIRKIGWQKR